MLEDENQRAQLSVNLRQKDSNKYDSYYKHFVQV